MKETTKISIDWFKSFSLQKGEELIFSSPNLLVNKKGESYELVQIIKDLTDFLSEVKNNPENFTLSSYDSLIISSVSSLDRDELTDKLNLVWYGLGLQTGDYDLWEYKKIIEEIKNVLAGEKVDLTLLIRNLREITKSEDGVLFSKSFLKEFIDKGILSSNSELSWSISVIFALCLLIIYEHLPELSEEEQGVFLKNTFYLAICADLPVRASIQAILFNTKTVFSLIAAYVRLLDLLAQDTEKIIFSDKTEKKISAVWSKYLSQSGTTWGDISKLVDFCGTIVADQYTKEKIFIALDILRALKAGTLQSFNYGDVMDESDIYRGDLIRLIFWFGLGEGGKELIEEYFLNLEQVVTFDNLITRLKEICNLNDSSIVENILILSEIGHKLDLLAPEQELIVYNESTGKFEWN